MGVVVPDLENPVFGPILDGIAARLSREGYYMLAADGGESEGDQIRLIDELAARRVDGLILATAKREDRAVSACLQAGIPTVLVNRGEDRLRVPTVTTDDECSARLAVKYLVAQEHRQNRVFGGAGQFINGCFAAAGV